MVRLNYGSSRILFFLPAVMKLVSQKRSPRCNELPVSCHYNPVREIRPAEKYFILWSVSTNQFKSSKPETPGRGKEKRRSSSREVLKLYLICFTRTVVAKKKKNQSVQLFWDFSALSGPTTLQTLDNCISVITKRTSIYVYISQKNWHQKSQVL